MSAGVEDAGWFVAGVSTVIASLSAAIAVLFKLLESKNTESIDGLKKQVTNMEARLAESDKKHDECQVDRGKLSVEVALLKEHVDRLSLMQCHFKEPDAHEVS